MTIASGAYFNNPLSADIRDRRRVLDLIVEMLDQTEPDGVVRLSWFSGPTERVYRAIQRALLRGVSVRVVMDSTLALTGLRAQLATLLGTDPAQPSCFIRSLGRASTSTVAGRMHISMALSSNVYQGAPVSIVGFEDVSEHAVGREWNDALVIRRGDVHTFLSEVHEEMVDGLDLNPAYRSERFRRANLDRYQVSVFPRVSGGDPVLEALNSISPSSGVHIYITMHRWSGERGQRIAAKLAAMAAKGVRIHVVEGEYVSASVHTYLAAAGIDTYHQGYESDTMWPVSRYMAVTSPREIENFVLTGTQDWTDDDLYVNETLQVVKWSKSMARRYAQHSMGLRVERRPEPDPTYVPPEAPPAPPAEPTPVPDPPLPTPDPPDAEIPPDDEPVQPPAPTRDSVSNVHPGTLNVRNGLRDSLLREHIENMIDAGADVIGLQEMNGRGAVLNSIPGWSAWIPPDSYFKGGDSTPIIWKKAKYKLISRGGVQFTARTWVGDLGAGPSTVKSKGGTWVRLRDRDSGRDFYLINNHAVASIQGRKGWTTVPGNQDRVDLAKEHFRELPAWIRTKQRIAPVFVTGDFNFDFRVDRKYRQPTALFMQMDKVGVWANWRSLGMPEWGTHGNRLIDYVAHSHRGVKPISHKRVAGPSDHNGVVLTAKVTR